MESTFSTEAVEKTYEYSEDGGHSETFEAIDMDAAKEKARDLLASGDWDHGWVWAYVSEVDVDGEAILDTRERVEVLIEPQEPPCVSDDGHDWQAVRDGCRENPGVHGLGGAAILVKTVCAECGLQKHEIVGDVNPASAGNRNGVEYISATEY